MIESLANPLRKAREWSADLFSVRLGGWIEARVGGAKFGEDSALIQAFRPDAEAIEEKPLPVSAHAVLYAVLTLLVLAGLWAAFGSLDRIVVAQGKIATRTPMIVMQPFTTSRITQIYVKAGDHVRKGQMLVSFDPAFAHADVASLEHKVRSLTASIERLQAQLNGGAFAAGAGDTPEKLTQNQIFLQEMSAYRAEMAQRDSRIGALKSQARADAASIDSLKRQLAIAQKIVGIRQLLLDQQAGAPLDVMNAQTVELDVRMRLDTASEDVKKLSDQRREIEAERRSYLDKWHSDHNQQLVQARQDLAEAGATLDKARKMQDFTQLTAPVDAVVLEIADRSVGSVLREAETLVTLVPDGANLYIEADVPSRDIGYLKVGNAVRVKLEAYPFQKYGTLDGRLDVISPDSVPLKQGDQTQLVYHVQVGLRDLPRELAARNMPIRPGLVVSTEIKTGKRSIASYILDPLLRTADESMREP